MFLATSKTDIAKTMANQIVALNVAQLTADQMVERTDLDEDSIAVSVTSNAIGQYVGWKLRPVTDAAVDKTIAGAKRVITWKQNRKSTES